MIKRTTLKKYDTSDTYDPNVDLVEPLRMIDLIHVPERLSDYNIVAKFEGEHDVVELFVEIVATKEGFALAQRLDHGSPFFVRFCKSIDDTANRSEMTETVRDKEESKLTFRIFVGMRDIFPDPSTNRLRTYQLTDSKRTNNKTS